MIEYIEFNNYREFENFYYSECKDDFPLVKSYIDRDDLYHDDDIVTWYACVECEEVICVFCLKNPSTTPLKCNHISVYEINKRLHRLGYGLDILNDITDDDKMWTLYIAEPELDNFYKQAGFVPCHQFGERFYVKDPFDC